MGPSVRIERCPETQKGPLRCPRLCCLRCGICRTWRGTERDTSRHRWLRWRVGAHAGEWRLCSGLSCWARANVPRCERAPGPAGPLPMAPPSVLCARGWPAAHTASSILRPGYLCAQPACSLSGHPVLCVAGSSLGGVGSGAAAAEPSQFWARPRAKPVLRTLSSNLTPAHVTEEEPEAQGGSTRAGGSPAAGGWRLAALALRLGVSDRARAPACVRPSEGHCACPAHSGALRVQCDGVGFCSPGPPCLPLLRPLVRQGEVWTEYSFEWDLPTCRWDCCHLTA